MTTGLPGQRPPTVEELIAARVQFLVQQAARPIMPQLAPPVGIHTYFRDDISQATIAASTLVFATPVASSGTGFSFQVPAGRLELVTWVGMDIDTPGGLAFMRFRFTVDGAPIRNYQAPPVLLGTINNPTQIYVELRAESLFEMQFTNSSPVASFTVTARLGHWSYDPGAMLPGGLR